MKQGTDVIIHETAIIKRPELVEMGSHVAIDPFFYLTTAAQFGDWVHINSHVSVIGGEESKLKIGNNVAISTGCRLICRSNDFWSKKSSVPFMPVEKSFYGSFIEIQDEVVLGTNVVVLPNVIIGKGIAVGANSLVKESIIKPGLYVGSPVRYLGARYD